MRSNALLAMVLGALLAVPGSAAAASVNSSSKGVQAASATVSSCGSLSGLTVSWTVVSNVVTSVNVDSIPTTCRGASLSLTLVNSSNSALSSVGPVTVSSSSQTLTPAGSPSATSVSAAYVALVGP